MAAKLVTCETRYRSTAPARCSTANTLSVEKKRSATRPTKNGEIRHASANVPKIAPAWSPENLRVLVRYAVMVTKKPQKPEPTEGSVVNHIGVKVRDYDGVLARAKAAGLTSTPVSETQSMVAGPDGLKVELVKDPAQEVTVMNHHVHFFTQDV